MRLYVCVFLSQARRLLRQMAQTPVGTLPLPYVPLQAAADFVVLPRHQQALTVTSPLPPLPPPQPLQGAGPVEFVARTMCIGWTTTAFKLGQRFDAMRYKGESVPSYWFTDETPKDRFWLTSSRVPAATSC